jgi:hypothetical protein
LHDTSIYDADELVFNSFEEAAEFALESQSDGTLYDEAGFVCGYVKADDFWSQS